MKRIFFLIASSYLLMQSILFGQTGQTGLAFLKHGVGGRAAGMGEAYTAIAHDPSAAYYNAALLPQAVDFQLLLMHKEWIQDTKIDYISAVTSWKDFSFGLSINSTSINDIELRTRPGPPMGKFDSHNASIGITGGYAISPDFSLGLTGKFLYEKIYVDESSGYAFDVGGWYRTPWDVQLGFAVNNLGFMNALLTDATRLPVSVRAGGGYQIPIIGIDGTLTLASDVVTFTRENKSHLHVGSEFEYKQSFSLRIGYQTGYESKKFSAGFGIRYDMFKFDYAFVPFGYDLGSAHTFSLILEFN